MVSFLACLSLIMFEEKGGVNVVAFTVFEEEGANVVAFTVFEEEGVVSVVAFTVFGEEEEEEGVVNVVAFTMFEEEEESVVNVVAFNVFGKEGVVSVVAFTMFGEEEESVVNALTFIVEFLVFLVEKPWQIPASRSIILLKEVGPTRSSLGLFPKALDDGDYFTTSNF